MSDDLSDAHCAQEMPRDPREIRKLPAARREAILRIAADVMAPYYEKEIDQDLTAERIAEAKDAVVDAACAWVDRHKELDATRPETIRLRAAVDVLREFMAEKKE